MQGILGIALIVLIAWSVSEARSKVRLIPLGVTLLVQVVLAAVLLRIPFVSESLGALNHVVTAISTATREGTSFVFDYLGGAALPFELTVNTAPFIFATQLLPQVLFFAVLVALFWYWGVLPAIIKGFSLVLQRFLGIGGAVGVAAAASIFVGMVESPLIIRAYLRQLTRSEFFTVITCGMSTVAGSIMVLYVTIIGGVVEDALGHILTASILNVLGAILVSRVMVPDDTLTDVTKIHDTFGYESSFDAITRGTSDGIRLIVNIAAMLIVLISLVALVNYLLATDVVGEPLLSIYLVWFSLIVGVGSIIWGFERGNNRTLALALMAITAIAGTFGMQFLAGLPNMLTIAGSVCAAYVLFVCYVFIYESRRGNLKTTKKQQFVTVGFAVLAVLNLGVVFLPLGDEPLSLQWLVGSVFAPISWCMGIPWVDAQLAGSLMGIKLIVNELAAYQTLGVVGGELEVGSRLILTYSLCGFTNLGSLGILIGGVSAIVPERRADLLVLGPKTLLSGTLVAFLTGSIVGFVSSF